MVLWSGQYFIRSSTINPAHHLSGDRGTAYWVIPLCRVACTLTVSRYPFLPIMKARRKPRCLLRFHKRSLQQHWCLTGFRFTTIPYFKSYVHNLSVLSTCPSNSACVSSASIFSINYSVQHCSNYKQFAHNL